MSRMEIIGRAVFTALGIWAAVGLYSSYPVAFAENAFWYDAVCFLALTLIAAAVLYFLVVNNGWLVRWLANGAKTPYTRPAELLVKSLRVGLVFVGFALLCQSATTTSKIFWAILQAGPLVNRILVFGRVIGAGSWSWAELYGWIYGLCTAALAVYLIFGAPHFVRWQVRRCIMPDVADSEGSDLEGLDYE